MAVGKGVKERGREGESEREEQAEAEEQAEEKEKWMTSAGRAAGRA
jgi:hypothetical protein